MAQSNANNFNINRLGGASELQAITMGMMSLINTGELVRVLSVDNDGVSPVGFVSVQPLVYKIDGDNNTVARGVIHNVPYFRIQGGKSAIIIDPQEGDIGFCGICSRDISMVKRVRSFAPPNMRRNSDISDAVYFGGMLNGTPEQYIHFKGGSIKHKSPVSDFSGNITSASGVTKSISTATGDVYNVSNGVIVSNQSFFNNINNQLANASSCQELKDATEKANTNLDDQQTAITDQLAKLNPILELLDPPNINNIVTWAQKLITNVLTPMVAPIATYEEQLVEIEKERAEIDRISKIKAQKFTNCEI